MAINISGLKLNRYSEKQPPYNAVCVVMTEDKKEGKSGFGINVYQKIINEHGKKVVSWISFKTGKNNGEPKATDCWAIIPEEELRMSNSNADTVTRNIKSKSNFDE